MTSPQLHRWDPLDLAFRSQYTKAPSQTTAKPPVTRAKSHAALAGPCRSGRDLRLGSSGSPCSLLSGNANSQQALSRGSLASCPQLSEDDGCYTDNIVFHMTSRAGVQGWGGQCSISCGIKESHKAEIQSGKRGKQVGYNLLYWLIPHARVTSGLLQGLGAACGSP